MRFCALLFSCLLVACQSPHYHGAISDHFDGRRFYNIGYKNKSQDTNYKFISLWLAILQNPWPKKLPAIHYLQRFPDHPNQIKLTIINHSTVLLESKSINVLIDPIYSYRASPVQWLGPARFKQPGRPLASLPKIDLVLISHNHYDHLDIDTLITLKNKFNPLFIVPLGNKFLLKRHQLTKVVELDWWQTYKLNSILITMLPAQHDSRRSLFDIDTSLWCSYGIKLNERKIYFAGDTGYGPHFAMIKNRWGKPDISFLPIGAYEPRKITKPYHLNPNDAVMAHLQLQSKASIAIHWGTFQLGSEQFDQPAKDLQAALISHHLSEQQFALLEEGSPLYFSERHALK